MKDLWKSSVLEMCKVVCTLKADSLNLGIVALEEWIIVLWAECLYSSHDPLAQVLAKRLQGVHQQTMALGKVQRHLGLPRSRMLAAWGLEDCSMTESVMRPSTWRWAMALHKQTEKLKWQDKSARDNFLPISLAKFGGRVVLMPLAS